MINKAMLLRVGSVLGSVLTTLIAALLALSEESTRAPTAAGEAGDDVCSLTEAQAGSIHAVVALWHNSSCAYNMTLASIVNSVS